MLRIELLRGKGFPQSEDDPNPCTTQARISILSPDFEEVLGAEQCSSVQEHSNAPFYKDTLDFPIDMGTVSRAAVLVKIAEFSRRDEPFIMFYGLHDFALSEYKTKKELVLSLTQANPVDDPQGAAQELEVSPTSANGEQATLGLRLSVEKVAQVVDKNTDADVVLKPEATFLSSHTQLVPAQCEYVWLRLVSDKRWTESFRQALSVAWRSRAPLAATGNSVKPKTSVRPNGKKASVGAPAADGEVRTIGEVILKKWCCRRIHQVLTRVRLSAEKFSEGDAAIAFTPEEEVQFRTEKKTRAKILETMAVESLTASGSGVLRDWLDRLWVLFSTGIDSDPSGGKALSYDVRKQVHDCTFEEDDTVLLLASLMYFFVPSLPFEECQSITEHDVRSALAEPGAAKEDENRRWEARLTPAQKLFTTTLVSFIGPLVETLTEAELSKALRAFKPAVLDAHQRIAKGGKNGVRSRLLAPESARLPKGDGIHIKHLDKLGHRKEQNRFV